MFHKLFKTLAVMAGLIGLGGSFSAAKGAAVNVAKNESHMEIPQVVQAYFLEQQTPLQSFVSIDAVMKNLDDASITLLPAAKPRIQIPASEAQQELALTPLPPGLWTGMTGLAGLGIYGFVRNIRKILR